VKFSIITPSFRNSPWLKLCIASVADQQGVEVEHIVQDSCSDDGTQDWLPQDRRVKAFIEKDSGMYDAVNRGLRRATGDIFAYLNCDEQYLPGALKAVHDFFETHPEVDVVFPDTIVTDGSGKYVCHRLSLVPLKSHLQVRFSILTCAMFFRRRVLDDFKIWFNMAWRDLGDAMWVRDLVNSPARLAVLRRFTSVFADTGDNMNLKPNAIREAIEFGKMASPWVHRCSRVIVLHHRLRLLAGGAYFRKPFDYELYTLDSPDKRVVEHVAKPTGLWPGRGRGWTAFETEADNSATRAAAARQNRLQK